MVRLDVFAQNLATAGKGLFSRSTKAVANVPTRRVATTPRINSGSMPRAVSGGRQVNVPTTTSKVDIDIQASKPVVASRAKRVLLNAGALTAGTALVATGVGYTGKALGYGLDEFGSGAGTLIDNITGRSSPATYERILERQIELQNAQNDSPSMLAPSESAGNDPAAQVKGTNPYLALIIGAAVIGGGVYFYNKNKKKNATSTKK